MLTPNIPALAAQVAPPVSSAGADPVVVLPRRVAGKARTLSGASGYDTGTQLRRDTQQKANQPISALRQLRESAALVRELADSNGLASTAIVNLVAMANSGYRLRAYETWTQEFSRAGLIAAETVLSALGTTWDYSKGYVDRRSLESQIVTALLEVALTGGVGAELVLDTYRLPRDLLLFPYDSVTWKANGRGGRYPYQKVQGAGEADLNYPTVFVAEAVKTAKSQYTRPFVAAGAQKLFHYESFIEDSWRVIRQAGEPRIVVKLNYDKVRASAPPTAMDTPEGLAGYMDTVRDEIQSLLSNLAPEDALVIYDLAEVDHISASGEKKDFKDLMQELSGVAASALKSNASMLGMRAGGSQNVASTEAMLSTMVAELIQTPVAELFSRALTMAVRLYGIDCYIEFEFVPISLRPKVEMAAHESMIQAQVLERLSLGLITDDEAQVALGLGSKPEGSPELSGTMFYKASATAVPPAGEGGALNQNLKPPGSSSAGGRDNQQRP